MQTHGKASTYKSGCRCKPCTQANTAANTAWRAGNRARRGLRAPSAPGRPWTEEETRQAFRDDLTIAEIAKVLGRSYEAVRIHRYKYRALNPSVTGRTWTEWETQLALREDLTIAEIAEVLGRSYEAVKAHRYEASR